MSKIKHIKIENKIATYDKADGVIVCDNDSYEIEFAFDSEWDAYHDKKARFIVYVNGRYEGITVPFSGNICPVPPVYNVRQLKVGVFVDKTICTTTEAVIDCHFSILSGKVKNLTGFGGAASVDDGAPYYVLKKELTDYKEAHKDDYTNEQIDKMLEGVGGGGGGDCSDVYILGDDETLDDVPEYIDVVIDPEGEPSGGGGGGGDIDLTGVLKYTPQKLTEGERNQARTNIGAVSQSEFNEDMLNLSVSIGSYMGASLKWDGVLGDRYCLPLEEKDGVLAALVHISDETIPSFAWSEGEFEGVIIMNELATPISNNIKLKSISSDGFYATETDNQFGVFIVPHDNYQATDDLTFAKKGVYVPAMYFYGIVDSNTIAIPAFYTTALYILGLSFNNAPSYNDLKDKPFGEIAGSDTVTWDGDISNPDYIDDSDLENDIFYFVKVSDYTPSYTELRGKSVTLTKNENGKKETVSYVFPSDLYFEATAPAALLGGFAFIVGADYTMPNGGILRKGFYLCRSISTEYDAYLESLTIEGYTGFTTVKKIDEKYLPSATIVYADNDKYLYATSDTSDTSKRMTASELKKIALGGNKVLVCTGIEINGSSVEMYLVPTSFSFGAFGSEHIGTVIAAYGEDINQYTTAEYTPTATTETEAT